MKTGKNLLKWDTTTRRARSPKRQVSLAINISESSVRKRVCAIRRYVFLCVYSGCGYLDFYSLEVGSQRWGMNFRKCVQSAEEKFVGNLLRAREKSAANKCIYAFWTREFLPRNHSRSMTETADGCSNLVIYSLWDESFCFDSRHLCRENDKLNKFSQANIKRKQTQLLLI